MQRLLSSMSITLLGSSIPFAQEQQPDIQWERGPMVATLDDNLAEFRE